MTRIKLALCAAVAVGLGMTAVAVPAAAEDEPPPSTTGSITNVLPVVPASATAAAVVFHYRCLALSPQDAHLYVAVKEGPDISPENTSSSGATSYFSTNWSVDQGPNALNCNGRRHVMYAVLHADYLPTGPSTYRKSPPLKQGSALVQICLFDTSGLTLNYSMKPVIRGGDSIGGSTILVD